MFHALCMHHGFEIRGNPAVLVNLGKQARRHDGVHECLGFLSRRLTEILIEMFGSKEGGGSNERNRQNFNRHNMRPTAEPRASFTSTRHRPHTMASSPNQQHSDISTSLGNKVIWKLALAKRIVLHNLSRNLASSDTMEV